MISGEASQPAVPRGADIAVVGFGWAGSIVAAELARRGHDVVVFERGPSFESQTCGHVHEPGNERWTRSRVQKIARETYTLRYGMGSDAVPLRRLDAFLAGEGTGGAGVLWGGLCPRYHPAAMTPLTTYAEQLGRKRPWMAASQLVDWPIGYDDLEPGYAKFEQMAGVAGDGRAHLHAGRRSADYAIEYPESNEPEVIRDAALAAGLTPRRLPSAEISIAYTNPDGVTRTPCENFGSTIATPLNTTIPFALSTGRVTVLPHCSVRRILHDKGVTTGLVYTDRNGDYRTFEVPRIVLSGWTFSNTRLLLLSGIGTPYDPISGAGTVGRNYANHISAEATMYWLRRSRHGPPHDSGWLISDFDPLFSKSPDAHVGGAQIASMPPGNLGFRSRFSLPKDTPRWGRDFKEALAEYSDSYLKVTILGEVVPMRDRYMDLDPVYKDAWGDPLLRITFNWMENERLLVSTVGTKLESFLRDTGADVVEATKELGEYYDTTHYQNSHASGGTIMGNDPGHSVVDGNLECWDARNLWVVGASVFPTNPAPNPTPTVAALAYRLAETVHRRM